ncbi:uncharacterized protein LOC133563247 isoform X3 [Nerophis ophidion]|uniref:uncharacterized protein LOC133563247 isoform X3 n=1 Tax=Nerophis ophidion TaxID=159077 RepID=UPI002ADF8E20|nr:uncharacterized protein LOC133563247 isoform X3 [Nerophis ophidion]
MKWGNACHFQPTTRGTTGLYGVESFYKMETPELDLGADMVSVPGQIWPQRHQLNGSALEIYCLRQTAFSKECVHSRCCTEIVAVGQEPHRIFQLKQPHFTAITVRMWLQPQLTNILIRPLEPVSASLRVSEQQRLDVLCAANIQAAGMSKSCFRPSNNKWKTGYGHGERKRREKEADLWLLRASVTHNGSHVSANTVVSEPLDRSRYPTAGDSRQKQTHSGESSTPEQVDKRGFFALESARAAQTGTRDVGAELYSRHGHVHTLQTQAQL